MARAFDISAEKGILYRDLSLLSARDFVPGVIHNTDHDLVDVRLSYRALVIGFINDKLSNRESAFTHRIGVHQLGAFDEIAVCRFTADLDLPDGFPRLPDHPEQ